MRFHTNLPVRDLQASIDFYRVLFGAEPVKIKPDYAKFLPPGMDLNISFHPDRGNLAGLRALHMGIELPDQQAVDAAHDRLKEAGLISLERSTSVCCYANQDKFWVTDPNGYEWELYTLLEDTEQRMAPTTSCCESTAAAEDQPVEAGGGCC